MARSRNYHCTYCTATIVFLLVCVLLIRPLTLPAKSTEVAENDNGEPLYDNAVYLDDDTLTQYDDEEWEEWEDWEDYWEEEDEVTDEPEIDPMSIPPVLDYTTIVSNMTEDGKWFSLDFGDYGSYNPNLIPHPRKNHTWIMVAQALQLAGDEGDSGGPVYSAELVCEATFTRGKMRCTRSPLILPIASTVSSHCTESLEWFNYFIGPNDPRVFMGPDRPYITYGSASQYTCLSQWIHDLRRLVKWDGNLTAIDPTQRFFFPTELQRPPPYGNIEKNWFAFWDNEGRMYLHYDMLPYRSFAEVSHDGTGVSHDLAPIVAEEDRRCMQRYLPELRPKEHIHQATNSLAITMCRRADRSCDVEANTYIATIFHHKMYYGHNLYEPYVMLFKNTAPFEIYAISSMPFWINGRGKRGEEWLDDTGKPGPKDQSQMMYITSMSWKRQGMAYQGFIDDELLVSFGIEDRASGAIDVIAGDLIRDLNFCSERNETNI